MFIKRMDRRTEETEEVLKRHCVRNEDGTDLEYLTFPLLVKRKRSGICSARVSAVSAKASMLP